MGKTGPRVSVIGAGTWQFGGEWGVNLSKTRWMRDPLVSSVVCGCKKPEQVRRMLAWRRWYWYSTIYGTNYKLVRP